MFQTIQIDLTVIGRLVRENPDLTKKVNFKDGEHQLLSVIVGDKKEPDKYGNNLNVHCRPKGAPQDNKWYIGQGKLWEEKSASAPQSTPTPSLTPAQGTANNDDMPF